MLAAARKKLLSATRMQATGPPGKSGKKRVRKFTPDDRAAHRIFEKSRREAFKERLNAIFQELAGQIPALAGCDPQRLSKHIVVEESITRCQTLHRRCLDALGDIRALLQERDEILAEVNTRRQLEGTPLRAPQAVDLHLDGLVELENEAKVPAEGSTFRKPETTQAMSCSPGDEGTDGHDHSNDDEAVTSTPQDASQGLMTGSTTSVPVPSIVPPLLPSGPRDEPMPLGLDWGIANDDPISESYSNPMPPGNLRPTQDASGINEFVTGPFPIPYSASFELLDAENVLPCQEFTFYDADTMAFQLEPRIAPAQLEDVVSIPPGYLPDGERHLGAGIS
ncbi:hypothetical protein QQX98_000842 [Neonectria punicea]|uniref:BHLH domain-containing protein n=1 Tax=Neonectria punicea TaxID=979145 RepID=A0ABR1HRM9_9HYPO